MKYVIFKENNQLHPVLFAEHTSHAQVRLEGAEPISAGFVKFDKRNNPSVYGKSESLGLTSRQEDEPILYSYVCNCGQYAFLTFD